MARGHGFEPCRIAIQLGERRNAVHRQRAGLQRPGAGHLATSPGQIAGDVANVAERVEVAFDERAARELRSSIKNFADLSTTLSHTVRAHAGDLDTVSRGLQSAVASLNRTASSAELMASRLDSSSASGQVRQIVDDMSHAAAELRRATAQVRVMSEQLSRTQNRLDSFLSNGDSVLVKLNTGQGSLGLLLNDPSLYRNGDSLLTQLRGLVTEVRTNPKKFVSVRIF